MRIISRVLIQELMRLKSKNREHREVSPGDTKTLKHKCVGRG